MRAGWLIKDGEVLASLVAPEGWRAHLVSPKEFSGGVGAVAVTGPALVVGAAVARVGTASHLRQVSQKGPVHWVGPGRTAVAVVPTVAAALNPGDEVHIKAAS